MSHLEYGSVVWVRLGQAWWPGTITTLARCPPEFVEGIRKTPVAVVKFFHENEFQDVHKGEHIYPYSCERKTEFIKRGQYINKNQSHGEVNLLQKFESDVVTAEKLTGGDMNILETIEEVTDYPTTPTSFHEPDFSSVPQSTLIERPRGCMPGEIVIGERESLKMRSPHSNSTQRVDLGKPGESHYREDCIVEREISSVSTLHKSVSDLSEHQTGSQLPLSRELLQSTQFLQSGQLLQSQAVGQSRPELFAAKEQNSNVSDFNTLKRDHSQGIWTVPSDLDRASLSHKVPRSDIQPDRLHKDFSHVPIRTKLSVGTVESEFTKVASNHDSDIREVTFRVPPMSSEVIDLESDPESPEMTEEDFAHVPIRTKFDVGTIESAFTQVASRHDSGIRQIPFRVPPMSSEVIDLESDEESPEITKDKDTPVSWEPPKEVVERTEVESEFEVMDEEVEDGSESLDEVMEEGEGDDESASHSEEGREEVDNESESHDEDEREEVEDEHKSYHKYEMVEEEDERESYHKDVAEKVEDEPQNNYEDGKEEVEDACQALYKKVKGIEEEPKPKTVDVGMEVDDDTNSETTPECGKVVEDESSVEAVTRSPLVVDEEEESDNSNESSESYSQVAVPPKSDLMALSLPKGDGNDFTGTKHMTNGNSAAETLLVGDAMAVEDEAMTIVETSKENDNESSALLVQESETIADKNAAVEDAVCTQQLTSESDSVKPGNVEAMEEEEVTEKEADSVKPGRGEAMEKEEVTGKETDSVKPERSEAMEEEDVVNGKKAGSATLDEKSEGDHKEEGESKHVESSEERVKDDEHKSEDMSVKEVVKLVSNRKSRKSDKGSSSQKRISKRRREPSQKTRKKAKVTEKKDASEATQDASIGDDDDDDDHLPDLSLLKNDVSKLKTGDLVWVKYRKDWWPSYIRNVYRKGRKYSIVFVACDQSYGIRVNSKHVKKLYVWDVPSFVNQSQEGFSSALHLCKLFHELQEQNQAQESQISAHDFFSLSPQAQVALLNQKKKTKGKGKGSTGKKKPKEVIIKSTSVKIPPRKALFDDPDYKNKMSDREKNKLKSAIKARKSDNEKLVRYMMSKTCIDRLWQIYNKEIPCDRHDMYQDPEMKNNPRLCSWGPFQLDDSDDQIMSVIQAFKEEILLKYPKQKDAYDYAFRVWVPEAIKDALRVIKKVPESDLDDALFKGYRETAIEKKYRTINL